MNDSPTAAPCSKAPPPPLPCSRPAPASPRAARRDREALARAVDAGFEELVRRIQQWIALPTIAAEQRNIQEGADYMARLATEAGFTGVRKVPTGGVPAVFGVLDAGAQRTVGIYFMYDVKQFDPAEWASPPLEGRIFDHELGRAIRGRGAVNQKGPEGCLPRRAARLQGGEQAPAGQPRPARRRARRRSARPISTTSSTMPEVLAAMRRASGVIIPSASQSADGVGDDQPRRQGHHRVRTGLVGRALGPRPGARHPFEPQGAGRQPGLAPGRGAPDPGHRPWQPAGDRRLVRACPPADARASAR